MCGRFTLRTPAEVLIREFGLSLVDETLAEYALRYNIAPTQSVLAVRTPPAGSGREAVWLHWGLIPFWADDPKIGNRMVNARAESVHEKPAYRNAFKSRRCLVPADGYYEWKKVGSAKQPYYFHRPDGRPFAFAGLWEHWQARAPDGPVIESCTLLTTEANAVAGAVHDRMPVILATEDYDAWLDPLHTNVARLRQLLVPLADDAPLVADRVSTYVNSPKNVGPACIEPEAAA